MTSRMRVVIDGIEGKKGQCNKCGKMTSELYPFWRGSILCIGCTLKYEKYIEEKIKEWLEERDARGNVVSLAKELVRNELF